MFKYLQMAGVSHGFEAVEEEPRRDDHERDWEEGARRMLVGWANGGSMGFAMFKYLQMAGVSHGFGAVEEEPRMHDHEREYGGDFKAHGGGTQTGATEGLQCSNILKLRGHFGGLATADASWTTFEQGVSEIKRSRVSIRASVREASSAMGLSLRMGIAGLMV